MKSFKKCSKKVNQWRTANSLFTNLDQPNQDELRLGLSVSKKIGNAVMRNRIKRLIRQVFLEEGHKLKQEKDYIVIARKPKK
nr:ribonuclease P protein component [Bacillus pumilus]